MATPKEHTGVQRFSIKALTACLLLTYAPYAGAYEEPAVQTIAPETSKLWSPGKIGLVPEGSLLIVDSYKNSVREFDRKGNYLGQINLKSPSAVAASGDGRVYIGSHADYSVTIFKRGEAIGHLGAAKNEFLSIADIAIDDATGEVYVADTKAGLIKIYYRSGSPKKTMNGFHQPSAVAVEKQHIYVLDWPTVDCPRSSVEDAAVASVKGVCIEPGIMIFNKKGILTRTFSGAAENGMSRPVDIAIDTRENLYVADASRKAVLVFDRYGSFVGNISSTTDELRIPVGLAVSRDGSLFVSVTEKPGIVMIRLADALQGGKGGSLRFKSIAGEDIPDGALGY